MKHISFFITLLFTITANASNASMKIDLERTLCTSHIMTSNNNYYANKLTNLPDVVYGLSIDGELSILQDDYLVRVIVTGKDGKQHLVMESYKEIQTKSLARFEDYGEETYIINGFNPDSIKIYTHGANLKINGFRYISNLQAKQTAKNLDMLAKDKMDMIRKTNVQSINHYNETHHLLWRADTTWLSRQKYETRKKILGLKDNSSSHGIEYYAGGIIEIDEAEQKSPISGISTSYTDNFDWRNRHGKNWMTHVKNQRNSNCCFLFSCVGVVEALTNLYYNQKLDLNLSEQELISCSGLNMPYLNGTPSDMMELPLNYLVTHGVCDSLSYPFVNFPYQPCLSSSITPIEQIKISGYVEIDINDENEIKKALINHGPLVSGIHSVAWGISHAMVLVGFGKLQAGDTIYHHLGYNYNTETYFHDKYLIVDEDDPRIGRTYMVYKNSYGLTDDDSNLGYMYIIHNNYGTSLNRTFYLTPPITSLNYSTQDIILEDTDGDGYYFWGLGQKPSTCPSWIPDNPDGDDSNYQYGPMDAYGNLEDLSLRGLLTFSLLSDYTYSSRSFIYENIRVCSPSKLTIKSTTTLYGNTKITVESNAEMIIDGGTLENAEIELNVGSKLIIKNGGSIVMREGHDFYAPLGATVIIEEGTINC